MANAPASRHDWGRNDPRGCPIASDRDRERTDHPDRWVTDDLEATERLLPEQFGTGAWTRIPDVTFGADTTTLRGEPVEFTAHISLGYAGDLQLELIQPVSGRPSTRSS